MARRQPAADTQLSETLDLILHPGGMAALWREGDRFRFYDRGVVLIDTADLEAAREVADEFCRKIEETLDEDKQTCEPGTDANPRLKYVCR